MSVITLPVSISVTSMGRAVSRVSPMLICITSSPSRPRCAMYTSTDVPGTVLITWYSSELVLALSSAQYIPVSEYTLPIVVSP